jgi:sugar lactone lactonase YvrE
VRPLGVLAVALAMLVGTAAEATGAPASVRPGTLAVAAGVADTFGLPEAGPATATYLAAPTALATDQAGDLYIADSAANMVLKVTPAGTLSIAAGSGPQGGTPTAGPATQSKLNDPCGLAVDGAGDLYIADLGNDVVEKVTPAGALSIFAGSGQQGKPTPGPATQSDLGSPLSLATDASGDLYIADERNSEVEKVMPDGTLSVMAGTGRDGPPTPGLATRSRLDGPDGLAVDKPGDVYIADDGTGAAILKVTPAGRLSVVAGMLHRSGGLLPGPAARTTLGGPFAIAVDAVGNLYIADYISDAVEEVTPAGVLSIIAGEDAKTPPGADQAELNDLIAPQGIAVSPTGNLYIASTESSIVEEMADAPNAHSVGPPRTAIGSVRVRGDRVTQTLSCLSGSMRCTLTATLKTAFKGRRAMTLARQRLTIAVGSFKTVTVAPNRTGSMLLGKLGTLRTALTFTGVRPTRLTTPFHGIFTLKARIP